MRTTTLDDIALSIVDGPFGSSLKTSDYVDAGVPVLQGKNITGDAFVWKEIRYITHAKALELKRSSVIEGDHLLIKIGSIGYSAIVDDLKNNEFAIIPANLARLRPDRSKVDDRYLHHWLKSADAKRYFLSVASATAQPALSLSKIKAARLPLPPLDDQRRIAAILDQADDVRSKGREAVRQLATLQWALFLHLFGDPFTNPLKWPVRALGDLISNVSNGITRRRAEGETGEDVVLRLRDIGAGWIDFSDTNRITLSEKEKVRFLVSSGDLLFIRVNGNRDYVGRCAVFTNNSEDIYFNDHIMRVSVMKEFISPVFLQSLLNSEFGRVQIARHNKTSAGQHTINQDGLSKIMIPLPDVGLQNRFAKEWTDIGTQIRLATEAEKGLDALFSSLQHRAFHGEF